jgi:hypothetical protein
MLTNKRVFFFTGQHFHAAFFSVWVSVATRLPVGGLTHRPLSRMYEHGGPSERIPVVDLSSDEKISSSALCGIRSSHGSSSATSIAVFLGRPVMTMSSSSVTPMKKRRCARRTLPTPKLHHLLLETP